MTMFPAHNLSCNKDSCEGEFGSKFSGLTSNDRLKGYEGCASEVYYYSCLGSDLVLVNRMAEDESARLTESTTAAAANEAGSSSKDIQEEDDDHKDEGWLQLSIGGRLSQANNQTPSGRDKLIELDLLPLGVGGGGGTYSLQQQQQQEAMMRSLANPVFHQTPEFRATPSRTLTSVVNYNNYSSSSTPNLLLQQYPSAAAFPAFPHPHDQDDHTSSSNYWGFRPQLAATSRNISAASSSSSLSTLAPPPAGYYSRPPPLQLRAGIDVSGHGQSLDFRVVDPPRRPHSGIWFMLQASQNQVKEPFLPQIPKSYLRIKDGRMTVRLVMKYLVNKLRLHSESEIEITCRGQQLLPFLTLQHVRDNVWTTTTTTTTTNTTGRERVNNLISLQPSNTTTDHLMLLHYGWSSTTA